MTQIRRLLLAWVALVGVPGTIQQSQGGQDSILAGIFDVIGATNHIYVEVGFNAETHDGGSGSNTFALKQKVRKWSRRIDNCCSSSL
jgi:hypothetical protein